MKNKNNSLISIVIPVYNVEKYLKQCVDSVLNQTYKNIEIILVDDGSTDSSGKICDELALLDSRIIVKHKKNGGLSSARNTGIETAQGEYITFVDSDDDIKVDYIEYLFELIKKYKTKMSICSYSVVSVKKNREKILNLGKGYKEKVLSTEECLKRMLCEKGFSVSACAKLYRKDLFDNVNFPIGKICEDNGTTYKLIMQCEKIIFGNISKYNYYKRENSIMTSSFNEKKLDLIELTNYMCDDILSEYPSLKDVVYKKKNHSKFSVLRQMNLFGLNKDMKMTKRKLISDLIKNKKEILKNPYSDKRDKLAILSLSFGFVFFKIVWQIYNFVRW